jgi:hypothetical protein
MDPVHEIVSLDVIWRGNQRHAARHGIKDLELRSAAKADRHHHDVVLAQRRTQVFDEAPEANAIAIIAHQFRRDLRPDHVEGSDKPLCARQDLIRKEPNSVDVGPATHIAEEHRAQHGSGRTDTRRPDQSCDGGAVWRNAHIPGTERLTQQSRI